MPHIDPRFLDVCSFVYRSKEDAEAGKRSGGTAFLVSVPTAVPDMIFIYAVTNWHVVVGGASVLRFNKNGGGLDILDAGPEDWFFDPRYDIAVIPITFTNSDVLRAQIHQEAFVSKEAADNAHIGPGEDVFMIGRFVDHDGGPGINRPTVRFGNISAMPTPILQENGKWADAYILDMHSRSGYSGSPVLVYRTPGYDLAEVRDPANPSLLFSGVNLLGLLGIHVGQFPERWKIIQGKPEPIKEDELESAVITRGPDEIDGFSGMTVVLPAWYILEVLDLPKLKEIRDRSNANILAQRARDGQAGPVAEAVLPEAEIEARRDAGLPRALTTPPKPFTPKAGA